MVWQEGYRKIYETTGDLQIKQYLQLGIFNTRRFA